MDVRAVDTTHLASKRLEIDKSVSVSQKLKVFTDDRLAAHESGEASSDDIRKPKVVKNEHEGHRRDFAFGEDTYNGEPDTPEEESDDSDSSGPSDGHILDVRV